MDADSFIVHIKINDIYKDIAEDVEKGFDTSTFELDRPLSKEKNKKVIELIKDELGGKMMKRLVELWAITYKRQQWWGQKSKRHKNVCHK